MSRREELAANLQEVEQRIRAACGDGGRSRDEITLVVVTKTYPASDVDLLAELGITDIGENRHPEAADKRAEVSSEVRWHFVGGLQTNKAGAVAGYADVVQSVDRAKLARSLSRGAESSGREIECLVQVDFGDDPGRSGVAPADVMGLADEVAGLDHLRLGGLMTVAPLGVDPRPVFDRLVDISAQLQEIHPGATVVSAGMSEDFEEAVRAGATRLRVGRSILGERPSLR
jgi:pyridoxal phosphate enzyme (YggS family)